MRLALGLEYDGTHYCGWQLQSGVRTVQGCVEEALSKVADHEVKTCCAGRTDTKVHAYNQVIHIQTTARRDSRSWVFGSNANLPEDISVTWAKEVEDDFHARYSAIGRIYRYLIFNRRSRSAILDGRASWQCRLLDHKRMQEGAAYLLGEHDFSAYRAQGCQSKNPVRTVRRLDVTRYGHLISIDIEANAFLYHMVRNIAGVLMAIGMGKAEPPWAGEVLETRNRKLGGVTAPAQGLYLVSIQYPHKYQIPQAALSFPSGP